MAHVPDGFFTFEGNGPLPNAKVNYWAITGGVGPYATARPPHTIGTLYP